MRADLGLDLWLKRVSKTWVLEVGSGEIVVFSGKLGVGVIFSGKWSVAVGSGGLVQRGDEKGRGFFFGGIEERLLGNLIRIVEREREREEKGGENTK